MSIYSLKPLLQHQLRPYVNQLATRGVTPNQITYTAAAISLSAGFLLVKSQNNKHWLLLPFVMTLRMVLNAMDGMLAREHGMQSPVGAVLNEVGDVVSDTALLYPLKTLNGVSTGNTAKVIGLSWLTEIVALAAQKLTGQRANMGWMGKSDRAAALGALGLWVGLGFRTHPYALLIMRVMKVLLFLTSLQRAKFIRMQRGIGMQQPDDAHHQQIRQHNLLTIAEHCPANYFVSWDGLKIYYRQWHPLVDQAQTLAEPHVVILLHRGHEHSARMEELAQRLVAQGFSVFAWDARGNGYSEGERDYAETFGHYVRDLDQWVAEIRQLTAVSNAQISVIASSMGAVIASAWVHDYAPDIRALVLATAAFKIRLYVPFAVPMLKGVRHFGLMNQVSSYVKARMLTHDVQIQNSYQQDPLISTSIRTDLLIDTAATGQRLVDDAGAITTPTLMLCAGQDWVVDWRSQRQFYHGLSSSWKEWQYYPEAYHALFHEKHRDQVFERCIDFIQRVIQAPVMPTSVKNQHQHGYSRDRADELLLPTRNPAFKLTKWMMQQFGAQSDSMAVGLKQGFDSGHSLEKVYQNQPGGSSKLGKALDQNYLNSIGWRGIRIRKAHLNELLNLALAQLSHAKVHIVDIAAGHGHYLFDLLKINPRVQVQMRDYQADNIQAMQQQAEQRGLMDRLQVVQADAFDLNSYTTKQKFHIGIASGLFELFSDNQLIDQALLGLSKQIHTGGLLLYTNQPWHPQQEFIARVLDNHQGQPWVMRCRSQAEMDQLVRDAGFEKLDMRIDQHGLFTVSLAIKR
ncbi:MAG: alpha/beta fold hydrolase [Pseudomonadota bacterium]|nr:alpha/beta fold hydrolase [Pseudomonadota bacterium]